MKELSSQQIPLPFGMKGIRITGVKEQHGSLAITIQKALEFGVCPGCGVVSQKIKDKHYHRVTDRPIFEKLVTIEILKRRWKCLNDLCELNSFTEEIEGFPKKHTHTDLFYHDVYHLSRRMTYTGVYKHLRDSRCRVSLSTIYQEAQSQLHQAVTVPKTVEATFAGLDEFSKGKDHDYGVVLVNLDHNKVIDVAAGGKTKKAAKGLLSKLDPQCIKACCIDMWKPFRDACYEALPGVKVVIDHFHVIKEINMALEKVRKRARQHTKDELKKTALFQYKELLTMGLEKLTPKQSERLFELLSWHKDLSRSYELKEVLRAIYAGEDAAKASAELDNWIAETKASNIPEMIESAETLVSWKKEILNFWTYRISNAATEGKVNKIKTLRRAAYNYNNFQSLRLKILEQE